MWLLKKKQTVKIIVGANYNNCKVSNQVEIELFQCELYSTHITIWSAEVLGHLCGVCVRACVWCACVCMVCVRVYVHAVCNRRNERKCVSCPVSSWRHGVLWLIWRSLIVSTDSHWQRFLLFYTSLFCSVDP